MNEAQKMTDCISRLFLVNTKQNSLFAVTEKQSSIKYESAVINSSMTGGVECFQSCPNV